MRAQRPAGAAPCVAATAESLPFEDQSFEAAMAIATIDHWQDPIAGLREMRRVALLAPPEAYLDEHVRRGMSIWARVGPGAEQRAVHSLRDDLASGRWARRNRDLSGLDAAELGLRLLVA
jgi:hypothetical protein